MHKRILLLSLVLMLFSASICSAADWARVFTMDEGTGYVDNSGIELRNDFLTFKLRVVLKNPTPVEGGLALRETSAKVEVNLSLFQARRASTDMTLTDSTVLPAPERGNWKAIDPDTYMADAIIHAVLQKTRGMEWVQFNDETFINKSEAFSRGKYHYFWCKTLPEKNLTYVSLVCYDTAERQFYMPFFIKLVNGSPPVVLTGGTKPVNDKGGFARVYETFFAGNRSGVPGSAKTPGSEYEEKI